MVDQVTIQPKIVQTRDPVRPRITRPRDMPGKRVQFGEETWQALDLLARDQMKTFQELADEAFAGSSQEKRSSRDLERGFTKECRPQHVSASPASQEKRARREDACVRPASRPFSAWGPT